MKNKIPAFFFMLLMLLAAKPSIAEENQDALNLVRSTADAVLAKVSENEEALKTDPMLANSLVNELVLPHFDFNRMTRSAMGRFWKRAKQAQQQAIVNEFRALLVRTYSVALLNYSGQQIEYLPLRETKTPDRVTVQTIVTEGNGGPKIPVDYRLYSEDGKWKVFDVVIDGISLVSNYRTSFSGQIRRGGIDGLISQLKANNSKG